MTAFTRKSLDGSDSEEDFRRLAAERLLAAPHEVAAAETSPSDYDLNPGLSQQKASELKPAAVLIPIIARPRLTVLLTLRTGEMGTGPSATHAGQVAFPGAAA